MTKTSVAVLTGLMFGWCTALTIAQEETSVSNEAPVAAVDEDSAFIPVENATLKIIETTTVAAQIAGVIGKLDLNEGMNIRAGDLLGGVRDEAVRLQVDRAEVGCRLAQQKCQDDADLRLAQKRSAVAANELERAVSANQRRPETYPVKEVERLQLVAESTVIEIERAETAQKLLAEERALAQVELAQAQELLGRHQIVAPSDGIVTRVEKRAGEWVEPGTALFQLVRVDRLRIEGFVAGDQAAAGLLGLPAEATAITAAGPRKMEAKVTFVSPEATLANGKVRVFIEIDNREGLLRPGTPIETRILR
jgi:multidrug resistance efflux pump